MISTVWKWIAAIATIVILALVATCYVGYRKIATGSNTVVVNVKGVPAHVFALLTNRDSLAAWLPSEARLAPTAHGLVQPGDTVRISSPVAPGDSSKRQYQIWVVREMFEPTTLAIDWLEPDAAGVTRVVFSRRDSLVAAGDSTSIVSTFTIIPTVVDRDTTGRMAVATIHAADRLRLGAARVLWRSQLRRLALHLQSP